MASPQKIALYLRAFIPSLLFNLRYFPLRQAVKLPILIYKPRLLRLSGGVVLESLEVRFGMIKLGFPTSAVFPNNGITLRIDGTIVFKGKCHIGNDCYVICGKQGKIVFGDNFMATAGLKIVSECGITFGSNTLVGWGNIFIDTNFHPLYDLTANKFRKAFGKISVGGNNWFSTNCMVMYGVNTPDNCVFGARSIITRGMKYESNCVYGGMPIRLLRRNIKRIVGQDSVNDYTAE